MRGFSYGEMELHVAAFRTVRLAGSQLPLFQLQRLAHFDDIFACSLQRGKFGNVAFQQLSRLQQFKRARIIAMICIRTVDSLRIRIVEHVDPGPAAHVHQAFNFQHD